MHRILPVTLLMLVLAVAGCAHPQTLRFTENSAVVPATRATLDLRYHRQSGWSFPEAPGTKQAEDKENWRTIIGGGILFRFHGGLSYREVEESDDVRPGERAEVNDAVFWGPETVKGDFRIARQVVGIKFGGFTDRFHFGGGFGMFYNGIQVAGSVRSPTVRGSINNNNRGIGVGIWFEGSPGFPPVRLYFEATTWRADDGKGFFYGNEYEVGVKGQFRGFELFAGYRVEEFSGRAEHSVLSQSRLKFEVKGPILGLGVVF